MGTRTPESHAREIEKLAVDLHTETSPETVLNRLEALVDALGDDYTSSYVGIVFLGAGGLPDVIRLLRGCATLDVTAAAVFMSSDISEQAGEAFARLCQNGAVLSAIASTESLIPPLMHALRDARHDLGRCVAARALLILAAAQSGNRRAIAEAGVMGMVLAAYTGMDDAAWGKGFLDPIVKLGNVMVCSEEGAARDLVRAVHAPDSKTAHAALVLIQDHMDTPDGQIPATLRKAGVLDALLSTLDSESPHCVAAAVGTLSFIGKFPKDPQALKKADGAIRALVRLIENPPLPDDSEKDSGVSQRDGTSPITMAVGAICAANPKGWHLLDSFLEAGGVPAVVKVLGESTCPVTLLHTAMLIQSVLTSPVGAPDNVAKMSRIAHPFLQAGVCQAAMRALKVQSEAVHHKVLRILLLTIPHLPERSFVAEMATLVPAGIVKFTMDHMAEAGPDMLPYGIGLFQQFLRIDLAQERMCTPAMVKRLTKWIAKWLKKADGRDLRLIPTFLSPLLEECPCFIPAAIDGNVIPGLVRALRKIFVDKSLTKSEERAALKAPLDCLRQLLEAEMDTTTEVWKSATAAGLATILTELLALDDEPTISDVVSVSGCLLTRIPREEGGLREGALVRELARLLTAKPPMAPRLTADVLCTVAFLHPQLVADWPRWGMDASMERLTMHSNPSLAGAAKTLKMVISSFSEQQDAGVPSRGAAGTKRPSRAQKGRAGPGTTPDDEQPSGAADTKSPGQETSRLGASPARRAVGDVQACASCGTSAEMLESGRLHRCTGCRSVSYCDKVCQRADWPAHKAACKRLQAA